MRDFEEQYGVQTLESAGEGEGGGVGATPFNGLYGEASSERGTFLSALKKKSRKKSREISKTVHLQQVSERGTFCQ